MSDHWQTIESALYAHRYTTDYFSTIDEFRKHEQIRRIDAALAFVREQREKGEWVPVTEWWEYKSEAGIATHKTVYNPNNNGIGIEVVYNIGKDEEKRFVGENLPDNIRLCRKQGGDA